MDPAEHRLVEIRPMELIREGYEMIKDQYWMLVGICAVGIIIGSVAPLNILLGPMMCGIYLCMFHVMRGTKASFETLFKGFEYFVESLVATLIPMGIMIVLVIGGWILMAVSFAVSGAAAQGSDSSGPGILLLIVMFIVGIVLMIVMIAVQMLFMFTYQLIVDRDMKALPAIKASIAAVRNHLMGLFLLMLLNGLFGILAMIFCYLPVFLYIPIGIASITLAYRSIFPEMDEGPPPVPGVP
jgi:uncharacterized membrane protein